MPQLPSASASMATRKRTRSTNIAENNTDHHHRSLPHHATSANTVPVTTATAVNIASLSSNPVSANAPPKRQRNNPPPIGPPPPVQPRTNYSLRNRSLTPDPRHASTRFPSLHTPSSNSPNRQRYNLRSHRPQSQVRLPQVPTSHPLIAPRRIRRPILPIAQALSSSSTNTIQSSLLPPPPPLPAPPPSAPVPPITTPVTPPTPPVIQPRQYRLVYISDDDDDELPNTAQATATVVNTTFNLVTDDEGDDPLRSQTVHRRTSRLTSNTGLNTRSRAAAAIPSSATSTSSSSSSSGSGTTINTQDFISGVAHVRLNRAIEIVIDSIQSLEGAVNNFDQLVFGLIYGRLGTRNEYESIEGMIRLSRILSLNLPSRLTQAEIDALPKILFVNKIDSTSSILLTEKCPICLTEFDDQETINKLHCSHLFHPPCISTWLNENDSCPTCRRKVMGE